MRRETVFPEGTRSIVFGALVLWIMAGFFWTTPARAEYVGGEGKNKPGLAVSLETVFGLSKRDVESGGGSYSLTSLRFFFRPTFKIAGRFALYGNIGAADYHVPDEDGALGLLTGGGAKIFLLNNSQYLNLYVDGQFLTFDSSTGNRSERFFAYQFSGIALHQAGNWAVYGGVKYSQLQDGLKADDKVGIVIGLDYSVTPMVFFTGEMHNFSDDAIYLGVGYRF